MTDIDLVYDHVDDIGTFMEQYGAHWKVNGKVCDANGDVLTYDESHPDHSGPNGTHPVVVGTVPSNP